MNALKIGVPYSKLRAPESHHNIQCLCKLCFVFFNTHLVYVCVCLFVCLLVFVEEKTRLQYKADLVLCKVHDNDTLKKGHFLLKFIFLAGGNPINMDVCKKVLNFRGDGILQCRQGR